MKSIEDIMKNIEIVSNNNGLKFQNSFVTDTGLTITEYFMEFGNCEISNLSGRIENEDLIIDGKITEVYIFLHTKHCSYTIECNADITFIGKVNQLDTSNTMKFDLIKLSNIKILDIYNSWDEGGELEKNNSVYNFCVTLEANKYREFCEKYDINTLKDGTKIDSLSNEDILNYIEKSFGSKDFYVNNNIAYNLFNNELPKGEVIYKYNEDFLKTTVSGTTLDAISTANCKDAYIAKIKG